MDSYPNERAAVAISMSPSETRSVLVPPTVPQLLVGNAALQTAGMLSGQLFAFAAAASVRSGSFWATLAAGAVGISFIAARLITTPAVGALADRRSAELLLAFAAPIATIAAVLETAVVITGLNSGSSIALLLTARMLEGLSAACATPTMLTLLSRATESQPAKRTRVMGAWELTSLAGLASALLLAGPLWDRFHSYATLVVVPIYALAIPSFLRRGAPQPVAMQPANESQSSLVTTVLAVVKTRHHRGFAILWMAVNAAVGLWLQYMPFLLVVSPRNPSQRLVGSLSGAGTSLVFAVVAALYVGGTVLCAFGASRAPRRPMMAIAIASILAMSVAVEPLNHGAGRVWWIAVALCIAGQGAITPTALSMLADLSADNDRSRSTTMGVYAFLLGVGQLLGAVVGAPIVARWQLDGLLAASAGLSVIGLAGLYGMGRPTVARVASHA